MDQRMRGLQVARTISKDKKVRKPTAGNLAAPCLPLSPLSSQRWHPEHRPAEIGPAKSKFDGYRFMARIDGQDVRLSRTCGSRSVHTREIFEQRLSRPVLR